MRDQVKAALRYPIFVLVVMAVAVVIVNLFVIPPFAKVYAGFKAPAAADHAVLIGVLQLLRRTTGRCCSAAWSRWRSSGLTHVPRHRAGRYRWDSDQAAPAARRPIILRKATLARFARSFRLAVRSGVPIVQTMTLVAQVVDNAYMAQRIEQMRDGVERGESVLRTATATGVFTPVVLQMIAVGEETGRARRPDARGRRHVPARGRLRPQEPRAPTSSRSSSSSSACWC